MRGRDRIGVESHAGGRARPEIVDEHVGRLQKLVHDGQPVWVLEIDGQRLLAAVEPEEIARFASDGVVVAAGEVAARGPFDFHDTCAEVSELSGRVRRGHGLLEAHDADARERLLLRRGDTHGAILPCGMTLMSD